MSHLRDQDDLRTDQYEDASNLEARVALHRRFSTNDYAWQRWVFDRLDLPARSDILELGCGRGDLWLENARRVPSGWRLVLSDASSGMLREARRRLGDVGRDVVCLVSDAQLIPFSDEHFDAVVANHVLYHVADLDSTLGEIGRVLRPGGKLFAATNGLRHLRELLDLVRRYVADAEIPDVAARFGLENGAPQLSRHFAHVTRQRQENALVVTEPDPLVAYALSMLNQEPSAQAVEALRRAARQQIAAQGAILIQKDSGMFVATKL